MLDIRSVLKTKNVSTILAEAVPRVYTDLRRIFPRRLARGSGHRIWTTHIFHQLGLSRGKVYTTLGGLLLIVRYCTRAVSYTHLTLPTKA